MGQGSAAVQWLAVERNGDGTTEVLQLWDNNGNLGMILYSPDPNGPGYVESWSADDMGQQSAAVQWLAVDRNGDGKTGVLQLWDNSVALGNLGMILYSPDPNGPGYIVSWSNANISTYYDASNWFVVNRNGDGMSHILQTFNFFGTLAMALYDSDPNGPGYLLNSWTGTNMGNWYPASAWLAVEAGLDGSTNIIQLFQNAISFSLGMVVYEPSSANQGYAVGGYISSFGTLPATALAFFAVDVPPPANTSL